VQSYVRFTKEPDDEGNREYYRVRKVQNFSLEMPSRHNSTED